MYVHKRCVPEGAEQDLEKVAHGYCGECGKRGTIWHVKGTEDSYKTKIQGVTKTITAVGTLTDEDVTFIKTKLNTTYIAPIDTGPEVELPEGIEAVEDAVTEAVEAVVEASIPEEKEPDKTEIEAEPKPSLEGMDPEGNDVSSDDAEPWAGADAPLEAEPEPSVEEAKTEGWEAEIIQLSPIDNADTDVILRKVPPEAVPEPIIETGRSPLNVGILMRPDGAGTEKARKAEIARLEAELAELKKK